MTTSLAISSIAGEVVDLVLRDRLEGVEVGVGQVADVHELAELLPVAHDAEDARPLCHLHEGPDDEAAPHPLAVGDAVAEHGVLGPPVLALEGKAEEFLADFARPVNRVDVDDVERAFLVDDLAFLGA